MVNLINAATAFIFLGIGAYWLRLGLRTTTQKLFLLSALALMAHGIGGTLYHLFPDSLFFWRLDIIPLSISLLSLIIELALAWKSPSYAHKEKSDLLRFGLPAFGLAIFFRAGTHWIWHLLCAYSLFLLFRYVNATQLKRNESF